MRRGLELVDRAGCGRARIGARPPPRASAGLSRGRPSRVGLAEDRRRSRAASSLRERRARRTARRGGSSSLELLARAGAEQAARADLARHVGAEAERELVQQRVVAQARRAARRAAARRRRRPSRRPSRRRPGCACRSPAAPAGRPSRSRRGSRAGRAAARFGALDAGADDLVARPRRPARASRCRASSSGSKTVTSSCRPSCARVGPTSRQRLIFAGAVLGHRRSASARARNCSGVRRSARTSAGRPERLQRRAHAVAVGLHGERERPGERLAAVGERALDDACAGTGRGPRRSARARRARCRRSAPGGRPCATRRAATRTSAGELREHRRDAVGAAAGRGGEPLPHLLLHHRDPARHAGQLLDRLEDRRRGDAVRQVGDDLRRRGVERGEVECERVAEVQRRVRVRVERVAQRGLERAVDLDDVDVRARARRGTRTARPSPPPISSTTSSAPTSAARAMTPRMFESMRKFWPRSRLGRMPNAFSRRRLGWLGRSVPAEEGCGIALDHASRSSYAMPRRSATKRAVWATYAGWLRSLRTTCGVRYGASVSTSSRSSGTRSAAAARSCALG